MTTLSLFAALLSGAVTITGDPGVAVRHAPLQGTPLCVWNDSSLFTAMRPGMLELSERVFRFPNGSYSDIYHWNGTGRYGDDSVWIADSATWTPGWAGESIFQGITTTTAASLVSDDDTTTYWWSNPEHPTAPGWFMMDLGVAKQIDSFSLWLGDLRPDSVQIARWSSTSVYPLPYLQADSTQWRELGRLPATALVTLKLPSTIASRYIGIRPIGRPADGWQARELKVWYNGKVVSKNAATATSQSAVYAVSTHPASRDAGIGFTWDFGTFMKWIQAYPGAEPMICVNYGTGTPQEAAAWVRYANVVKGYGIKRWQVGNETSGYWEEGGCVSARRYAVRFVAFARAMKAVDPTIEIDGPVLASTEFTTLASGDYDKRSWMQGFLVYVDSVEQATGERLLDGVDFHDYPYWFSSAPSADDMMAECDSSGAQYDSLLALMDRTLADPSSREVLMSEFNTSTVSSSLEMSAAGGTAAALQFAHFVQRFGDRGVTNLWELFEGGGTGPDGSFGSLSVMIKPTLGEWSSLAYPPNAAFWSTRTLVRQWLDSAGGDTVRAIGQVDGARLFAVRNAGRVSVLAFNLQGDSTALALDPALFPAGGDLLSWGEGEYLWNGTTTDARALPNNGPSSRTFASNWDGTAKIPPYGMLVVRGTGRAAEKPRTAHWLLSRTKIPAGDTLAVSGWTTADGNRLAGGTWTIGEATGALEATDGAWDGPSESWIARIPASTLATGDHVVRIAVRDTAGALALDSAPISVTGSHRSVLLVSDFEEGRLASTWDSTWHAHSADGSTPVARLDSVSPASGAAAMKDSVVLTQPSDLGYTTFFSTTVAAPPGIAALDSTYGLVGLVFDLRTTHSSGTGSFQVYANLSSVTDYDNYYTTLPTTDGEWVRDTVLFDDLSQGGWGNAVDFDVAKIVKFDFRAVGAGTVTLSLDNVYLLGTDGADVGLSDRTVRNTTIPALSLSGRILSIRSEGAWTLRLVGADGRVQAVRTGSGASAWRLPAVRATRWAVLEGSGMRQVLAIPPALR